MCYWRRDRTKETRGGTTPPLLLLSLLSNFFNLGKLVLKPLDIGVQLEYNTDVPRKQQRNKTMKETVMKDAAIKILSEYQEDSDSMERFFHGASRESFEFIQSNGWIGRVDEADVVGSNGKQEYLYVAPFATLNQCFEYAGERGVIYVFEYSDAAKNGEIKDDVISRSGSEYLLPIKSGAFRVYGYLDLLSGEFVQK